MLIAIALACLIPWNYAKADDGPFITELGALEPVKESQIRMESEDVVFTYAIDGRITGKATFNFVNTTNAAVKLDTIFPLEGNAGDQEAFAYAKNVTVKVNGKSVITETKKGYYPERDEQGDLVTSPEVTGIIFPLSFVPRGKVQVIVAFEPQTSLWLFPTFPYLVGSGAGWSGTIGRADFSVIYPVEPQIGWVDMKLYDRRFPGGKLADKVVISGTKVTHSYHDLEPGSGSRVLNIEILPLSMAKNIVEAQKEVMEKTDDPESYWELAKVYKDTVNHGFGPGASSFERPEFARQGYWDAVDKAVSLESMASYQAYSSDSVSGVYRLLKLYSNSWDVDCRSYDCRGLVNPEKYSATYDRLVSSDHSYMFGRENGDDELIAFIKEMDEAWRRKRSDLLPITTSTADLVSPLTGAAEDLPQPASSISAPTEISFENLPTTQNKEQPVPAVFWFLVGLAGGLFSWSAWTWFTRRNP